MADDAATDELRAMRGSRQGRLGDLEASGGPAAKDTALIAAAQRVEH
jgi:hypothetical protein